MKYRGELNCEINCNIKMNISELLEKIVRFNEMENLKINKFNISDSSIGSTLFFNYLLQYKNLDITIKIKSLSISNIRIEGLLITHYGDNVKVEYLEKITDDIKGIFEIGDADEV